MESLEAELAAARELDVDALADAVETIGFECTRCGACCKSDADDPHTATVFPDEVRRLTGENDGGADGAGDGAGDDDGGADAAGDGADDGAETDRDWRDVARPMPFGLADDGTGETFEWALATDACGDCVFYEEREPDAGADDGDGTARDTGPGHCTVHDDRPLVCRTYPFSVALGGTAQPMGGVVEESGMVRAHECEGLGREIDRADAEAMAATLRERAIRELEEAIAIRDGYEPRARGAEETVVVDSEGAKRPDGTPIAEDD